jgi:hypothetical protein
MIKCCKNCIFYREVSYYDVRKYLCGLNCYYEISPISGEKELQGEWERCVVRTSSGGECGPNLRKFLQKKPWWRFW